MKTISWSSSKSKKKKIKYSISSEIYPLKKECFSEKSWNEYKEWMKSQKQMIKEKAEEENKFKAKKKKKS